MLNHRPKGYLTGKLLVATIGFAFLIFPQNSFAQNLRKLTAMYGQGVHDYFDGQFKKAESVLTKAAKAGSVDPRVFLFRGLARAKMGQDKRAKADFDRGAFLEVAQFGKRNYDVGRSLIRVQGVHRIQIENARNNARKRKVEARKALAKRLFGNGAKSLSAPGTGTKSTTPNANLPDVSTIKDDTAPFQNVGGKKN